MDITILIPTTGERPNFVEQAIRMVDAQTVRDLILETKVIENLDKSHNTLAENYRKGYEEAEGDLVVFWEDDDFYNPDYLETMIKAWEPGLQILGTNQTVYYHLGLLQWRLLTHRNHSSAMNIVLKSGLQGIPWEPLTDPFLDLRIWHEVTRGTFKGKLISETKSLGIKHGIGRTGGRAHSFEFIYDHQDPLMDWLKNKVKDPELMKFYKRIHQKVKR